ncbi:putative late blight resistance protein homolog R1B-8 [Rhododendron vialii]|uniref:putative late blight resistance protein homolog R1B-8 n=1 Tax=Rhododendron vialii TaxID=182163 RepID=UPI00265EBEA3|nr:putative late blight resistance protein homolog R1B-8 [Rhododendron vialii]
MSVLSVIPVLCQGEIGTGYLDHLRYLAYHLPTTWFTDLYSAVKFSNLLNLETLNLQGQWENNFIQLSADIFKMVKLRHLYSTHGVFIYHVSSEEATRFGFDHSSKLDSLQTLNRICPCEECQSFLVRTPNLRKLGVHGELISQDGVLMLPDLEFLKCLETLRFTNTKFFSKSGATLPTGLKLPLNVTRLTLKHTYLQWKELSILLTGLPSLEVLKLLVDSCCGPVWDTSELEEGFPQLKYLRFESLDIEEWNASEDQFPGLEVLVLRSCQKLERIPIDFANLNELREITMNQCSPSLEESSREIQEELRNKKGDDDCLNLLLNNNTAQKTLSFTIDLPGIPSIDGICITLASVQLVVDKMMQEHFNGYWEIT